MGVRLDAEYSIVFKFPGARPQREDEYHAAVLGLYPPPAAAGSGGCR